MKKTLVALAVLAASGASFAQVTMTGEATWGYRATTTGGATTSDAGGFGVDTSELYFDAAEDIGGGNKVTAHMAIGGLDRGGYNTGTDSLTAGQDFFMTIGGGSMGTLKLATTKAADYLGGSSSAAVVGWNVGYDGKVYSGRTTSDNITYTLPAFGPVTVSLGHREAAAGAGANPAIGEGVGTVGAASVTGQKKNWITAKGAFGGLKFDANYAVYDSKASTGTTLGDTGIDDTSLYAAVSYDFGVAKVGYGFENRKKVAGTRFDQYLAASTTFGAFDLGVDFANRKDSDEFATAGTKSGWGLAGVYHLSKRTSLIARTGSWESAVGVANRSTETDFYIDHTF
jgi:hypothetical protein